MIYFRFAVSDQLTRNVSSSFASLTERPFTAFPFMARFLTCSSVGDVELVESTVTCTDGWGRTLVAGPFLDTAGARANRLALGDR